MPLNWQVLHAERLVHAVVTGEVSAEEIQDYLGSIISQHAMPYGKIFDISAATSLSSPERLGEIGDTVRLYDRMKLGSIGPLAVVTGGLPEHTVHAEAFVRAADARRPARLFTDVEAARAWLLSLRLP